MELADDCKIEIQQAILAEDIVDQVIDLREWCKDLQFKWTVQRTLYDDMKGRLRDGKPENIIVADGSYHCIVRLRTCANGAFAF